MTRAVALVGPINAGQRRMTHTGNMPVIAPEKILPIADVVLIVSDSNGGAMLFRYTSSGEMGGDTWHASVEAARAQAEFEYGEALLLPWLDVPDEISDAHQFAVRYAHERLNDRGRW
jgi:hypothetical protein